MNWPWQLCPGGHAPPQTGKTVSPQEGSGKVVVVVVGGVEQLQVRPSTSQTNPVGHSPPQTGNESPQSCGGIVVGGAAQLEPPGSCQFSCGSDAQVGSTSRLSRRMPGPGRPEDWLTAALVVGAIQKIAPTSASRTPLEPSRTIVSG